MIFLSSLFPAFSTRGDTQGAQQALQEARALRAEIEQAAEPSREQYLRCIRTYRQVYIKDPHYSGADDAIWEAGQLYQQMGDRYHAPEYYREAVKLFRFLFSDYGGSPFCPGALLRAGDLCLGPLQDKAGAETAYVILRSQYPQSRAATELASRPKSTPVRAGQPIPVEKSVPAQDKAAAASNEPPLPSSSGLAVLESIRHWTEADHARVIIDLDRETGYDKARVSDPDRIYFDIKSAHVGKDLQSKPLAVGDDTLKQIRVAQYKSDTVRVVLDLESADQFTVSEMHNPFRIVIDMARKGSAAHSTALASSVRTKTDAVPVPQAAKPTQNPQPAASREPLAIQVQSHPAEPPKIQTNKEAAPVAAPHAAKSGQTQLKTDETRKPPATEPAGPVPAPPVVRTTETRAPTPENPPKPVETVASAVEVRNRSPLTADAQKAVADLKGTVAALAAKPGEGKLVLSETHAQPVSASAGSTELSKPGQPVLSSEAPTRPPAPVPSDIPKPKVAMPTSSGDRTLTRELGLKISRIVIDPGHGGHDTGTIGPGGLMEKDLVLEIAKALKRLLEQKLNAQVFLTREQDVFVPLEERTSFANHHQADLFISIHANASSQRSTSGVETYYLDFARSASERETAARENAATSQNIRDLEDLIKQIIQADKSKESRELAATVQRKLFADSQHLFPVTRNRGVRRAPFVVLIGANMPSILAEVAFISNPRDEKLLKKQEVRERLAQALFAGVEGYAKSLGGFVAQDQSKSK